MEQFRSALPHGERLGEATGDDAARGFDPRSRTGSDPFRYKRRKVQAKRTGLRETGPAVPDPKPDQAAVLDNNLIHKQKEYPRTRQENAGRFRFAPARQP